jgi:hypothetical protein
MTTEFRRSTTNMNRLLHQRSSYYLNHAADWLTNIIQWQKQRALDLPRLRKELSPVFVIGANRSGTSVVTYLLSQHPELEGLFSEAVEPHYSESGHSIGFCESMHIWRHLLPDPTFRLQQNHLPFWGLPNYIGQTYRDRAKGDSERRRLAWNVEMYRKSDRTPLIKDQMNTLRVGMICDVFPNARFVLVSRSWQDFTSRGVHKWSVDGSETNLDRPLAGFHWNLVNLVTRYDLEIYAPGRYATVWLDNLHMGQAQTSTAFAKLCSNLSLAPHDFDFSAISKHWKGGSGLSSDLSPGLDDVTSIVAAERQLLADISQKTHKP